MKQTMVNCALFSESSVDSEPSVGEGDGDDHEEERTRRARAFADVRCRRGLDSSASTLEMGIKLESSLLVAIQ